MVDRAEVSQKVHAHEWSQAGPTTCVCGWSAPDPDRWYTQLLAHRVDALVPLFEQARNEGYDSGLLDHRAHDCCTRRLSNAAEVRNEALEEVAMVTEEAGIDRASVYIRALKTSSAPS